MANLHPHGERIKSCDVNPEVAGVGIVAAFVTSTCLTLLISVVCVVFKAAAKQEEENQEPQEGSREDGVHWLWEHTCKPWRDWVHEDQVREDNVRIGHRVLDTVLLGLSLNQLIAGLALWVCAASHFRPSSEDPDLPQDAHAVLAYNMSAACSFSQLQVPYVLHKKGKQSARRIAYVRRTLFDIHMLLLLVSAVTNTKETHNAYAMVGSLIALAFSWYAQILGSETVTVAIKNTLDRWCKSRYSPRGVLRIWLYITKVLHRSPVLRTTVSFAISACYTLWAMVVVVQLKFDTQRFGYDPKCHLNGEDENEWTFGQILVMLMLLATVLPGVDAYFEEVDALKDEAERSPAQKQQEATQATVRRDSAYSQSRHASRGSLSSIVIPSSPARQGMGQNEGTATAIDSAPAGFYRGPPRRSTTISLESQD